MLEAVSRQKTCDMVAAELTAFITSQGLKAGDRLPTEHELAASFGVSRLSLREATMAWGFWGSIVEAKLGDQLPGGPLLAGAGIYDSWKHRRQAGQGRG